MRPPSVGVLPRACTLGGQGLPAGNTRLPHLITTIQINHPSETGQSYFPELGLSASSQVRHAFLLFLCCTSRARAGAGKPVPKISAGDVVSESSRGLRLRWF